MPTSSSSETFRAPASLSPEELRNISIKSCDVVAGLGTPYTWITSYLAGDKIYCIQEAESADIVRCHAGEGGFPADVVTEVAAVIGPETAKA